MTLRLFYLEGGKNYDRKKYYENDPEKEKTPLSRRSVVDDQGLECDIIELAQSL